MFTRITDTEELLAELNTRIGEEIVFHYHCEECDDEQVTNEIEVNEALIDFLIANGYLISGLDCTNCGYIARFLNAENIFGIED